MRIFHIAEYVLLIAAGLISGAAIAAPDAQTTLSPLFSDHSIVQRDRPVPIWGTAAAGSRINVVLLDSAAETVADADGRWSLNLPAQPAAEQAVLSVFRDGNVELRRHGISIGDVWLCSGQSNMEFELYKAPNAESEIRSSSDAGLGLLHIDRTRSFREQTADARNQWVRAGPDSSKNFSAACYYMGRELRKRLKVPIGLIAASWGGTRIEEWLSPESLSEFDGTKIELAQQEVFLRDPKAALVAADDRMREWGQNHVNRANDVLWNRVPAKFGIWEDWADSRYSNFDGLVRYRVTFNLDRATAAKTGQLKLGRVDDADWTSLNGSELGHMHQWDAERIYPWRKGSLRSGVNSLDVLVLDTGGGGGLWGGAIPTLVFDDGTEIVLKDGWQSAPVATLAEIGPIPDTSWQRGEGAATLHNGMIAQLGGYAIKGFAWYQGESNAAHAAEYPPLLKSLVADWRSRFGGKQFLVVQLAGFGQHVTQPTHSDWAELREAQRIVAIHDGQVRLVPAIDIGDRFDIHPTNKKEVGRRLALAATASVWNVGADIKAKREENTIKIDLGGTYQLVGGTSSAIGFELCDGQKRCRYAPANLVQPDIITLEAQAQDREIRYLWSNSPLVSIFDINGIPLAPFKLEIGQ